MRRFTFYLVVLIAVAVFTGLSGISPADAARVQVSQESTPGAGDFDANVLGYIDPYVTSLPAVDFYQYNTPNAASYNGEHNGGPFPVSSRTQIFLVEASDGLSLFVVHDNPNDGSGGHTEMQWDVDGDTAGYLQGDDPGEGLGGDGVTTFTTTHTWYSCCTDGFVIGTLEGAWSMFGSFRAAPSGIAEWAAVNDDGIGISLELEVGRRVRLQVPIEVSIDIKPGSFPNSINLGSHGLIPVAILSSETFDATMVNPETVELAGAGVDVRGKSNNFMAHEEDVNGDGLVDLVVQVATENLEPDSFQDGDAVLTGSTYDGRVFEGTDEIRIVPIYE